MFAWRRLLVALIGLLALIPMNVAAQTSPDGSDEGVIIEIDRSVTLDANESAAVLIVIGGDAVIDGLITGTLWVIDGDATIRGRVDDDVMIVNGRLTLLDTAVVNNVSVVDSTLERAPGATVTGDLSERSEFVHFGWGAGLFSTLVWFLSTVGLIIIGLLVTAVARRRLDGARDALRTRTGASLLAAVIAWIGLPVLAVLAAITIIGIPLALAIALVVLPVLWVAGYLVVGTETGAAALRAGHLPATPERPYLTVTIGMVILQVIGLIPFIGGLVVGLAGIAGSGALISRFIKHRRGQPVALRREPMPA